LNNIDFPKDIQESLTKMVEFQQAFTRPDDSIVLFGDSTQSDTFARVNVNEVAPYILPTPLPRAEHPVQHESTTWRVARFSPRDKKRPPLVPSLAFPHGGNYFMRSGPDHRDEMFVGIDCGPFGFEQDPHHGHADALSFELYCLQQPWFVDSGVYSTHAPWEWRRYFRGTRSHNTVVIDNKDQTLLVDSRRAFRPARSTCHRFLDSEFVSYFEGTHDGYRRLSDKVIHRRMIWFVRNEYWLIVDQITGAGRHQVEVNYHCPPEIEAAIDSEAMSAELFGRNEMSLYLSSASDAVFKLSVFQGNTDPVQGWRSNNSGEKTPAPTLTFRSNSTLPLTHCLVVAPVTEKFGCRRYANVISQPEAGANTVAVMVKSDQATDYLISAPVTDLPVSILHSWQCDSAITYVRDPVPKDVAPFGVCLDGSVQDMAGKAIPIQHFK
jgi:hypothetical protein